MRSCAPSLSTLDHMTLISPPLIVQSLRRASDLRDVQSKTHRVVLKLAQDPMRLIAETARSQMESMAEH